VVNSLFVAQQQVPKAITTINEANSDALIFVGGLSYENDWKFMEDASNVSEGWTNVDNQLSDRIVFESHIYDWSGFGNITSTCELFWEGIDEDIGWVNDNDRAQVITEIGNDLDTYVKGNDDALNYYYDCLGDWITMHKTGFAYWVLGGSYYARDDFQQSPSYDWFGLLTIDWQQWHNKDILVETKERFAL